MDIYEIIKFFKPENYLIVLIISMLIAGIFAYATAKLFSRDRSRKKDVDRKIKEVFRTKRRKPKRK